VGFIAYNSAIHFYNIAEGYNQPHEVTVLDVEGIICDRIQVLKKFNIIFFKIVDAFLPYPDNLLINLKACKELIKDLLLQLPKRFENIHDTNSALGAALQVAFKMMVCYLTFSNCLPNIISS
jgi:protein transport protein SEC24